MWKEAKLSMNDRPKVEKPKKIEPDEEFTSVTEVVRDTEVRKDPFEEETTVIEARKKVADIGTERARKFSPFIDEIFDPKNERMKRFDITRQVTKLDLIDLVNNHGNSGEIANQKARLDNQEYEIYFQALLRADGDTEKLEELKEFLDHRLSQLDERIQQTENQGEQIALVVQWDATKRARQNLFNAEIPRAAVPVEERREGPKPVSEEVTKKPGFFQRLFRRG